MSSPTKKCKDESAEKPSDKQIESQGSVADILKYDELRAIFQFLKLKDLSKTAVVCKSWKDAAFDEIASRLSPQILSERFLDNNGKCYSTRDIADDLIIKPYLGIVFVIKSMDGMCVPETSFFEYLPSSCEPLAVVGAYDIIPACDITDPPNSPSILAFLPKIPHLRINKQLLYLSENHDSTREAQLFEETKNFFEKFVWDSDESKCVFLLTNQDVELTGLIEEYFQKTYKPGTVALLGGAGVGLESGFKENDEYHRSHYLNCIVICLSSPSLQSWSVVIPDNEDVTDERIRLLQNFKENIQLKKYSLAFMSTCSSNEKSIWPEYNFFKSIFPEVPLVGFSSWSEYGLNTLNTEREEKIQHSDSTVFLILSYC